MPTPRVLAAFLLLAGCGGGLPEADEAASGPRGWRYTFSVDRTLSTLQATVCFDGRRPNALAPTSQDAPAYLREARWIDGGIGADAPVHDGRIDLSAAPGTACVHYAIDLAAAARARRGFGTAKRAGGDMMASSGLWLWAPHPRPRDARSTARFELPEGVQVSVPWRRHGSDYLLDEHAYRFIAYTAFGLFQSEPVRVPGAVLDVVRLDGDRGRPDQDAVRTWLTAAGTAAATLHGSFPVPRAQVLVAPVEGSGDLVAFGTVARGGGASVLLFLSYDATEETKLDALRRDWVAVHEFSHLALPYVRRADAWLSEGLATYYQELLRARAGLQTPEQAWHALDDGYRRGAARGTGRSVGEESASVYETGAFQRVYWAGAAVGLQADVALRTASGGRRSLDTAVAGLRGCCMAEPKVWRADDLVAALDRAVDADVFVPLSRRALASSAFPSLRDVYAKLGLIRDGDGVRLASGRAPAQLRVAIMTAPAPRTQQASRGATAVSDSPE